MQLLIATYVVIRVDRALFNLSIDSAWVTLVYGLKEGGAGLHVSYYH